MPVWPKSLYTFRASLQTARTSARLRKSGNGIPAQALAFSALTRRLAATEFWRQAGIEEGVSYAAFRSRVAPRGAEQLAPAIARMKKGEPDVLWPGRCALFALSSGTTGPASKWLPVTEESLAHFRAAGWEAMLFYTARVGHAAVFRGRHLILGGPAALAPVPEAQPHPIYSGDLSGIAALNLPPWVEQHLFEPGAAIARQPETAEKWAALRGRVRGQDISLVAGIPNWVLTLAHSLRGENGQDRLPNLQALWPNFECYVHTGVPLAPFQGELRSALGASVNFHEVYASSEGLIAAQDAAPGAGLRLLTAAGIFFEFLPWADFDETRLEQSGSKALPLAEVAIGVDYVLLLTTPGGLARYVLGDIVRFTSLEPPRLVYVGRTALALCAFGERVVERDLTEALVAICHRHGWMIVNFHVAPLRAAPNLTGQQRGRHEWWIELRPGTVETPIGPPMASELDAELQRLNESYATRRKSGAIDSPVVRLVMPGVFEHWLRFHHRWGGQHKIARSRPDRVIADELAQVTNFARD